MDVGHETREIMLCGKNKRKSRKFTLMGLALRKTHVCCLVFGRDRAHICVVHETGLCRQYYQTYGLHRIGLQRSDLKEWELHP